MINGERAALGAPDFNDRLVAGKKMFMYDLISKERTAQ
jgi:hypothetical protein